MNTERLRDGGQARSMPAVVFWIGLAVVALGLMILVEYLATRTSRLGMPFERLVSYQLVSYANLLLIGSTILYLSHLRFTSERVGRWASGFATVGAICLTLGMLVRRVEAFYVHPVGQAPIAGLYEVMSLFSAITVVIYLVMEKVYRTRSAGAFVMPIVVSAVLFEIWLVSNDQAAPDYQVPLFKSYWIHAHVLTNFLGYGAFAVAALLGGVYLLRHRAERHGVTEGFAMRSLPDLWKIDRLIHQAILVGFPLFTFATILGAVSAYEVWGRFWAWDPKETWALVVWLTYAFYFYLRYVNHWSGMRAAWWAIIGFAVTVFCFFGVNLIFSGLHSYDQLSLWLPDAILGAH
ncbi:c-type cytochrome biogenesis protein CcsB [Polaromonas sp.]|uniref:c-type cytochrome biogenesis protein CcsB n=1 Tax=Polaromonas sp. TaxID=1869339 RepID=UPI00178FDF23|nr:c-type cytochrome biogenesis protein CcsB [Polaromonas sp.]NMM05010.1 c-type cytochrome biogenesis protein CcsB [Polaromonas sp.]